MVSPAWTIAVVLLLLLECTLAKLDATETPDYLIVQNERLYMAVDKSRGVVTNLYLDDQNLLGTGGFVEPTPGGSTGSGSTGIGPYLDCYCVPSGFYQPGGIAPYYRLINGTDATGTEYGGVVMGEVYPPTGQVLEQYWFVREGETGIHTFSRLAYHNETTPFLRNLQEFRTLFRPNSGLWTHLLTNEDVYAPLPNLTDVSTVQDATWKVKDASDPYVVQMADYFTKYTFQDTWRDHDVHGMFSDGSRSTDGSTYGAWLVMNTRDTYFGGPLHSDLIVDGIVYNYMVSNHHGDGTPNITNGYDRTIGPQYYHFNKGSATSTMFDLRNEAVPFASPSWNADFYDSIAGFVPNYIPSSGRGTWKGKITVPPGAQRPIAVLAQNGVDFQDNVQDTAAYQYWADIDPETGEVGLSRVKADTYRLTVYADGIWGQYTQDGIRVRAGETTTTEAEWVEESAGTELWRIGRPDKSSGEYRHGWEEDTTHPLHPPEYRIYWAVYDFPTDFPDGVRYVVGESDPGVHLNYVHWSVFGGYANSIRTTPHWEKVNNWTLVFDVDAAWLKNASTATFTVQLAGAKTAAGNTDVYNASEPYANLPYTVSVNGNDLDPWIIPYYHSSSCAVRSAVICYNIAHKFIFDVRMLVNGTNEMVLSLPANATDYETAVLPVTTYVQYDALRLEVR